MYIIFSVLSLKVYVFLQKLIPKYFMGFVAIINGI